MALPWAEVNESAPARVAEILELRKSPRGGRKRWCPFCGGRNFSPLKRAFYCYSGCGGRAYSNVDTAARVWEAEPAEACHRLAGRLGIACADPEPPWHAVAAHESPEVAGALGLRNADGRWQWDCPCCGGTGTLRSYRHRWRCSSAACVEDEQRGWRGHVDLAMAVWHTTPVDACFRLAAALRGGPPAAPAAIAPAPGPREERPDPRERALAAIRCRPGARTPDAFYRLLLDHMRLGPLGRDELLGRGIDPGRAEAYGFRSAEPGEWRSRILPFMAAFSDDELLAAGFPRRAGPQDDAARALRRLWWPGFGRAPLLVIPILDGECVAGIRFRNLGDPGTNRCPRYASPKDVQPDAPFHAAALEGDGSTLHVVEGELNAFVLSGEPYLARAAGIPGAGGWQDAWGLRIPDRTRFVVGWFDDDRAGRRGAARIRDSLAQVRGRDWARARWRRLLLARDACDLHRNGKLAQLLRGAPWIAQEADSIWTDVDETAASGEEGRPNVRG